MSKLTFDFSVLEPASTSIDFAEKLVDVLYPTLRSFFSLKRIFAVYSLDKYAEEGKFETIGRYRLEVRIIGLKVHTRLTCFV